MAKTKDEVVRENLEQLHWKKRELHLENCLRNAYNEGFMAGQADNEASRQRELEKVDRDAYQRGLEDAWRQDDEIDFDMSDIYPEEAD